MTCLTRFWLAVFVCLGLARAGTAADRPDIVLILADDLGFSDLGCYGSEILTPNVDRLAKEGLRFTQFYSAGSCCPSRAALLTGLYPHQTGVGQGMTDYQKPGYRGNLNSECVTIAELLGQAGYQTFMTGKWHLTRHTDPGGPRFNWPLQRGFNQFYGTIDGAGSYFDPATLCRDNQFVRATGEFYYTDAISDHASQYIKYAARSDTPFFLYVAYTAPHWPLHALEKDVARYRGLYAMGWDEVRVRRHKQMIRYGIVDSKWPLTPRDSRVLAWDKVGFQDWHQKRMEVYAAQIDNMDRGIGRILETLHQVGRDENTLIFFLSDNGGSAEEILPDWKGLHIPKATQSGLTVDVGNNPHVMPGLETTYQSRGVPWANASNTPFRLYKQSAHEGGIATPLVVRWPAVIRSGKGLVHDPAHIVDLMPTCLDAARVTYPDMFDGKEVTPLAGQSLAPLMVGRTRERGPIFWEHEGNRAVRDDKWKLVARHKAAWELYDIEADRTEMNNLAAEFPTIVKYMTRLYDDWAERSNVLPWN